MAGKSDYLENKFIDWFFRGQSFTAPTTTYVAMLTAAPATLAAVLKSAAAATRV